MIPAGFQYAAPASLDEALALLAATPGAKPLSGGSGLFPALSHGAATPPLLVDLRKVPGLGAVAELPDGTLSLGARLRYQDALADRRLHTPARALLAEALAATHDPQVRNVATLGGSLALGSPAGDFVAALLASDARVTLARSGGRREVSVEELLGAGGPAAGEVIVSIALPAVPSTTGSAYEKFSHPASGWAVVGVAAVVEKTAAGSIAAARVALTGAAARPVRLRHVEAALAGAASTSASFAAAAAKLSAEGLEMRGDHFASPPYRAHLAEVLIRRALARAATVRPTAG